MASTINASTSAGGGVITTADSSGVLALQAANTTISTISATGESVTGNISATGTVADGTAVIRPLVSGTAVTTTSGTSATFTGIPSWVKRITVAISGFYTSGTSNFLVQFGTSGGIVTTGYVSDSISTLTTQANITSTAGMVILNKSVNSGGPLAGVMTLVNITGNIWVANHVFRVEGGNTLTGAGNVTLSGVPTDIKFTTVNGTDTFTAGSINILYE
ncbi:hypothetical protein UFOVP118_73 [uncultured Caudovirales phage]|uniref:Uncharacterized protein n=1 Tax=uncultured Caudovirales phage TaxID=2100421 RepID=A0A6J5L593_9CAUD|nr:hypothetical protein UFOVP118_73 [uncultured Caudovirales phage]